MQKMGDDSNNMNFCNNCKREIAAANFVMHEIHCRRNIILCDKCKEPVPRSEMEAHIEEEHALETCDMCQVSMEKCKIEEHKPICPKRPQQCAYCELQMPASDLTDHIQYCGTRTEPCQRCNQFIMIKDQVKHDDTNCLYPPVKVEESGGTAPTGNGEILPDQLYGSSFVQGELSRMLHNSRLVNDIAPPLRPNFHLPFEPSQARSRHLKLNTQNSRPLNMSNSNTRTSESGVSLAHRRTRARPTKKKTSQPKNQGVNSLSTDTFESDRQLALQLAADLEKNMNTLPADSTMSPDIEENEVIEIPCEFCNDLMSADILYQHQIIFPWCHVFKAQCNPGGVLQGDLDSTSEESDLEDSIPNNIISPLNHQSRPEPQVVNNLASLSSDDWLLGPSGPQESEAVALLPCEFCDQLFPETQLFQHQDVCDANCTRTPRVISPNVTLPMINVPSKRLSPEKKQDNVPMYSRNPSESTVLNSRLSCAEPTSEISGHSRLRSRRSQGTSRISSLSTASAKSSRTSASSLTRSDISSVNSPSVQGRIMVNGNHARNGARSKVYRSTNLDNMIENPECSTNDLLAELESLDKESKSRHNQQIKRSSEAARKKQPSESRNLPGSNGIERSINNRYNPSFPRQTPTKRGSKPANIALGAGIDSSRSLRVNGQIGVGTGVRPTIQNRTTQARSRLSGQSSSTKYYDSGGK